MRSSKNRGWVATGRTTRTSWIRRCRSPRLCNVAVGRLHAYWALELKIWDIAAAAVILTRAGGTLTDEYGNSWLHSPGGYIASNSVIHGWTMRCLQRVLERDVIPRGIRQNR